MNFFIKKLPIEIKKKQYSLPLTDELILSSHKKFLHIFFFFLSKITSEAVVQRYSVKNLSLQISQNSQENTFARVSFLVKLQARTVLKTLFLQNSSGDCFCHFNLVLIIHTLVCLLYSYIGGIRGLQSAALRQKFCKICGLQHANL